MDQSPLISVIIPTFQSEATLKETLRSLIDQTYRNFEVLIIDGLSTDSTIRIAEEAKAILRLSVHSGKDAGVYDAMNKGIKLAGGKYLYFLGSDDQLAAPDVFEQVAAQLTASECDLLYGDVRLASNNSVYGGAFTLERLQTQENICHQGVFYSAAFISRTGGYNTNYNVWADWDLNIRCFMHPECNTEYMPLVIAVFNDVSGVSRAGDPVFGQRLIKPHLERSNELLAKLKAQQEVHKKEIEQIMQSRTYRIGKRIAGLFSWLR